MKTRSVNEKVILLSIVEVDMIRLEYDNNPLKTLTFF